MRTRISLTLLLCLLTFGCPNDSGMGGHAEAPTRQSCETAADCEAWHGVCQHNICVDGPERPGAMEVSVVVYPPADRPDIAHLTIENVDLDLATPVEIQLPQTVAVNGALQDTRGNAVQGRWSLFFSKNDDLPGSRYSNATYTDDNGTFALQLPEGSYTVTLIDSSSELPEHVEHIEVSKRNEGQPLYLTAPGSDAYIRWTGRLTRYNHDWETRPVEDVVIWASSDDGTQSTLATTSEDGLFAFYLDRKTTRFRLHVRGKTIQTNGAVFVIPSTTTHAYEVDIHAEASAMEIPGEVTLGQLPEAVLVQGVAHDANGYLVPRARILAHARLDDEIFGEGDESTGGASRATIEVRTEADDDGAFSFYFPSLENVQLTGFSAEGAIALSNPELLIHTFLGDEGIAGPHVLVLSEGLPFNIHVQSAKGAPVADYDASLTLIDSPLLSPRLYNASIGEFSSAFSFFRDNLPSAMSPQLAVRPGTWRLTITPSVSLNFPNWTRDLTIEDWRVEDLDITLPAGVATRFHVYDADGAPLRNASVEIHLRGENAATELRRVAQAITDSDGGVSLLLPYPTAPAAP